MSERADYTGVEPLFVRRIPAEEIVLQKLEVMVARAITPEFAASVNFIEHRDTLLDEMVWELRGHVYAEHLAEQEVVVRTSGVALFRFPSSAWQHVKESLYRWTIRGRHVVPYRIRRWSPIEYETHERLVERSKRVRLDQFATFPAAPIRTPEKYRGDKVVRYERITVPGR